MYCYSVHKTKISSKAYSSKHVSLYIYIINTLHTKAGNVDCYKQRHQLVQKLSQHKYKYKYNLLGTEFMKMIIIFFYNVLFYEGAHSSLHESDSTESSKYWGKNQH